MYSFCFLFPRNILGVLFTSLELHTMVFSRVNTLLPGYMMDLPWLVEFGVQRDSGTGKHAPTIGCAAWKKKKEKEIASQSFHVY